MKHDEDYYIDNKSILTPMERRNFNMCYLHPKDERFCKKCGHIYQGIRENFHIKKYQDTSDGKFICWSNICKTCSSVKNLKIRLDYRKDYSLYIKRLIPSIRHRAKELNIPFDLDSDYLIDLVHKQNNNCYYSGEKLNFDVVASERNRPHLYMPSLDRLVPDSGYVRGNVAWCFYYINRMKNELSFDEFIKTCKNINIRFND